MLQVPDWGWNLNLDLYIVTGLWYTHVPKFCSLSLFWRCKEHPCPLSPDLGLLRMLEIPDWGLASWSWFVYCHWSLIHPCFKVLFSIFMSKVQRSSMSLKSWYGTFEEAGGSWLWFGIFILIWIYIWLFDKPMFRILAFYLDFEGAKYIHVL